MNWINEEQQKPSDVRTVMVVLVFSKGDYQRRSSAHWDGVQWIMKRKYQHDYYVSHWLDYPPLPNQEK